MGVDALGCDAQPVSVAQATSDMPIQAASGGAAQGLLVAMVRRELLGH